MGGYIGAKTGTLVASASDIRGDISATDATPEITLKNTTETDADGTRSGKITFKGEQSGGEESVLAQIQGSHDGASDDEKGDLIFKTNDGNDALAPTERLRINSAGDVLVSSPDPSLTITNTTEEDSDGGREGTIVFKGEQSGGELSTLAEIEASHDGTADDEKGDLIFKTNDGSDGASPTERLRIDSAGKTTITVEGNGNALELISTDADASIGPVLEFKRNSASPADNDQIGRIDMVGKNDADEDVDYVVYVNQIRDATDGTEDGRMAINTVTNGTMSSRMNVEPTETVFNDESNNVDFRVEGDNANCLFVDASADAVMMGTTTGAADKFTFNALETADNYAWFGHGDSNVNSPPLYINRQASDGALIQFLHASTAEGSISVSGSTVSFNGFSGRHESSGIPTNTLIGTVVSTIDELDAYPNTTTDAEGNTVSHSKAGQTRADHAKVEVSNTEGDPCVYGVVSEFDGDGKLIVTSVGIGSVRVTGACSKGDLLESNGDGTAKVQSDDIIRSKTIGKVTIGNSNTGEKLVSCVMYCG